MIVVVLLALTQLSCAAVPMLRNVMDAQIIDDIDGFLYDVPEYEDPLLIQHQLSSVGGMPIFTLLEPAKKRANSKSGDLSGKVRIEEFKKVIDESLSRLEWTKAKLEKGDTNIYTDVEKIIQSLKTLENSLRPDLRRVMNSLQTIMTMARPMKMSSLKDLITTNEPEPNEKIGVLEKPLGYDKQVLSVRVISDDKSESNEKPETQESSASAEKSSEEEKKSSEEEILKPSVALEKPLEVDYKTTKAPFEFKIKEKKNTNFDGEDMMSSYKLTWKAAGIA